MSADTELKTRTSQVAPTVENVVSTVNLSCTLDLKAIAFRARNTECNPRKFPWLKMWIREPKTTALLFSSGKMVITGAKSEQQSLKAARRHARIIKKLGLDVKFRGFQILNVITVYDFKVPFNLTQLAYSDHHSRFSIYEPELYPGLIYRMKQSKVTVQVFH